MNIFRTLICLLLVMTVSACSLSDIVKVDNAQIDQDVDRSYVKSRAGAVGLYYTSLGMLSQAVSHISMSVGFFTDELTVSAASQSFISMEDVDSRTPATIIEGHRGVSSTGFYSYLHRARSSASQSRTVLQTFSDSSLKNEIAGSLAVEGYSILLLAETMCSGIPLSTTPFEGTVMYGTRLSTTQLLDSALAKFDSALSIQPDSLPLQTFARIGKGRVLINQGRYDLAREAVKDVEPADTFALSYTDSEVPGGGGSRRPFWTSFYAAEMERMRIVNREGMNGEVWFINPDNIDSRLPVTVQEVLGVRQFPSVVHQEKFGSGSLRFPLARWVEAKMIEAESYMNADDPIWIDKINDARRSVSLPDTVDPGNRTARVNLLFRERAFWFYLEGSRLGDMRRLVKQYGRSASSVYPMGNYTQHQKYSVYGAAYVFSPPSSEYSNNYSYEGCISTNP